MAYPDGKWVIQMTTTGGAPTKLLTATSATFQFREYFANDVVVRGAAVWTTVTKGGAVAMSFRTVSGSGTSASGKEFSRITLVTAGLRAKLTVRKGLNVTVSAGSCVAAQVKTAVTGIIGGALLYVEARPYDYTNKTQVTLVTT